MATILVLMVIFLKAKRGKDKLLCWCLSPSSVVYLDFTYFYCVCNYKFLRTYIQLQQIVFSVHNSSRKKQYVIVSCLIVQILIAGDRMLLCRQLFTAQAVYCENKIREKKLKPSTFIKCFLK